MPIRYGSATELIITFYGSKVERFTLDPSLGEFIHIGRVEMPKTPKTIYSCNQGNFSQWDDSLKAYVNSIILCEKPYSHRYVGSMVSDVHR